MKDRLKELQEHNPECTAEEELVEFPFDEERERLLRNSTPDALELHTFMEKAGTIHDGLNDLSEKIEELKAMHVEILSSPTSDAKRVQKLQKSMELIQSSSEALKGQINKLKKDHQVTTLSCFTSTFDRLKAVQVCVLSSKLLEHLRMYDAEQLYYKSECKNRLKHYLKVMWKIDQYGREHAFFVADQSLTDEKVDEVIEKGDLFSYSSGIFTGAQAREILGDLECRQQEIQRLEKSILELNLLAKDLAIFVNDQGETIDRIDTVVAQTCESVEKGQKSMHSARKAKSRYRRRKICLIGACLCLAFVILLVLVISICIEGYCSSADSSAPNPKPQLNLSPTTNRTVVSSA